MTASPALGSLAPALAKAQADLKSAAFDRVNPAFKSKYASLAAIIDAVRPALAKQGISVLQCASSTGAMVSVQTMFLHISGEWIAESLSVAAKDASPQALGSALTYARRYSLSALACIAADEDDDGELAQHGSPHATPSQKPETKHEAKSAPAKKPEAANGEATKGVISDKQRARLYAIAKGAGWNDDDMKVALKRRFGFDHSRDITWRQYDDIVKFFETGGASDAALEAEHEPEPDHDDELGF